MKRLSIGIKDFKELIDKDAYYVDKTKFIANCINENAFYIPVQEDLEKH